MVCRSDDIDTTRAEKKSLPGVPRRHFFLFTDSMRITRFRITFHKNLQKKKRVIILTNETKLKKDSSLLKI